MEVNIRLNPTFSGHFSVEKNFFKTPVSLTYEDKLGNFSYTVTDGLSITGYQDISSKIISYSIGGTCSFDQLSSFITKLNAKEYCNIIFNETYVDGGLTVIHSISFNPETNIWTHQSDSAIHHCGGIIKFKLSEDSLEQFKEVFKTYKTLAFMLIEGHKALQNQL